MKNLLLCTSALVAAAGMASAQTAATGFGDGIPEVSQSSGPASLGPVSSALALYYGYGLSMSNMRENFYCEGDNQSPYTSECLFSTSASYSDSSLGVTGLVGYRFDLANGLFVAPELDATVFVGGGEPLTHARLLAGANLGGIDFFVAAGKAWQDGRNGDSFGMGVQYAMDPISSFFAGSEMRIEVINDDFGSETINFSKHSETTSWKTNSIRVMAIMRF